MKARGEHRTMQSRGQITNKTRQMRLINRIDQPSILTHSVDGMPLYRGLGPRRKFLQSTALIAHTYNAHREPKTIDDNLQSNLTLFNVLFFSVGCVASSSCRQFVNFFIAFYCHCFVWFFWVFFVCFRVTCLAFLCSFGFLLLHFVDGFS